MKKIKIGVVGLGNLGRACVKIIREREAEFDLVAIFSRRPLPGTVPLEQIDDYRGKIDVMLICVGSSTDAPKIVPQIARNFSTVDSYDTHAELDNYITSIRRNCSSKNVSIVGTGWDPGLFSLLRIYFDAFLYNTTAETFWGRGVSLGHTNAVKEIPGVTDAIQFTVPKPDAVAAVKSGRTVRPMEKHKRVCYVVAPIDKHTEIERAIKTMPNYFDGYDTEVTFVNQSDFNRRFRGRTDHGGMVLASDGTSRAEFKLALKSNPHFTACVMVAYAIAAHQLKAQGRTGVFTVADIAPRYLAQTDLLHKI